MLRRSCLALLLIAACRDSEQHVFQAPPPPAPARAVAPPAHPAAVDEPARPIGSAGPEARILSVSDAGTGLPVSLASVGASIQVMSLVARGNYELPAGAVVYVDIALKGPTDTTIAFHLGSPAPRIIAHSFEVPVARGSQPGLEAGSYSAKVRLMVNGTPYVSSAPIYFTVN